LFSSHRTLTHEINPSLYEEEKLKPDCRPVYREKAFSVKAGTEVIAYRVKELELNTPLK
jgi:hypothetical protein